MGNKVTRQFNKQTPKVMRTIGRAATATAATMADGAISLVTGLGVGSAMLTTREAIEYVVENNTVEKRVGMFGQEKFYDKATGERLKNHKHFRFGHREAFENTAMAATGITAVTTFSTLTSRRNRLRKLEEGVTQIPAKKTTVDPKSVDDSSTTV